MSRSNEQIVEEFYTALAAGEGARLLAIQCDDVSYNVSGHTPISGHFVGKKTLTAYVLPLVFQRLRVDTFRFATKWKVMCADERRIVCFMEADGYGTNGVRYDQRYVHTFEFRDGKISALWEFFDTALANDVLFADSAQTARDGQLAPFEF